MNAHIFALYTKHIPEQVHFTLTDADLVKRIVQVLRLTIGEQCIIFDDIAYVRVTLKHITKKDILVEVLERTPTSYITPKVTWLLPLLEREQFEHALTMLAVLGVTTIIPVLTENSRAKWGSAKDYERAHRLMIAACEQAKQYKIPELMACKKLSAIEIESYTHKILFDATGENMSRILSSVSQQSSLLIASGPEAGFSERELATLQQQEFVCVRLTPTILKASHAVAIGAGIIRTLI